MLRNYILIAFRNLVRHKTYSLINILGLSVGVACCLLLALYIQDELTFDKHLVRGEDLYRIDSEFKGSRGLDKLGTASPPIAMTMWDEIPEVESAVRVLSPPGVAQNLIKYEDDIFYETNGYIADSTLFDVFTFDLIEGSSRKALTGANCVVISETLARKLFGEESALDKSIFISQGGPADNFKITGVFRENKRSFLQANFFISMMSTGWAEYIRTSPEASRQWAGQNFVPSYLKLHPGYDLAAVEKKMNEVLIKHGAEDMKALGLHKTLSLFPVQDIYLRSDINQSPRITYLYVIASIAVFILLIACINFMNLSTAKATKRAGEIGIRKVMGAQRGSLVRQIMGEAMMIVLISIFISVILVQLFLPLFNQLTGKIISFNTENIGYFILALSIIALLTGLVAGRAFTDNREMESKGNIIINRASAEKFGIEPDKIVGQQIFFDWQGKLYTFNVIGVMEDYHQTSLKDKIYPTAFEMGSDPQRYEFLIASVSTSNFESTISSIRETWKGLVNDTPFEYSFLDENIQKLYEEDRKVSRIINSFALIAMVISCLGLYGLSSFMAERRFKEFGVRKVMGASVSQIVSLMSREFVRLVLIAFVVAVPLAWYSMSKWLEGFAYKIQIDAFIFVYAGLIAMAIALLTVSFESIRAAIVNPVESLRNE